MPHAADYVRVDERRRAGQYMLMEFSLNQTCAPLGPAGRHSALAGQTAETSQTRIMRRCNTLCNTAQSNWIMRATRRLYYITIMIQTLVNGL